MSRAPAGRRRAGGGRSAAAGHAELPPARPRGPALPDGQAGEHSKATTKEDAPFFTRVVSLLDGDGDSLASVDDDLDVDSREGEAPLFTKVVALLERESVLTDLLVESIEDYSTSDDEVSSASSLLSDPEKDSTEDNNSDERSHPAPLSRSFPSVDMVQTTREAEEEEDSGTGCATGQCAHHPEAPEAPGVLRQREPGGPWGPTCGSDLGPEEDSA
ncbi:uncharacterized protein LOC122899221 [Neovison vison]|uniref:uncharacterized protein LOC122899221 n=1 Tax=Neovison vison TaxID=452646 RepID=UPI001CF0CECE|nr:uncharacterized protein LOC122899221 [Neogale vison]